jgi:hypothetical protein
MADEYTVGFTIHEARDLVTEGGMAIDPLVVVTCLGETYITETQENKLNQVTYLPTSFKRRGRS